ncbi:MAG: sulfite exporter TauE/SafE family protein [Planctomycetota bacterium]
MIDTLLSPEVWGSILVLSLAALVQAAIGFGAALLSIPLLLWVGNDLMVSQVLVFTAMMPQNVLGFWRLRENVTREDIVTPALIRIAALPLGVLCLTYVLTWSPAQVNQLVGLLIFLAVVSQFFIGIEWRNATRWYWMLVTFGGSGFLQGLSGMSGPPLVLWVHGQRFEAAKARAFLFAMYISNFAPQLLILWLRFGSAVWIAVGVAILSLPTVLLGAMLGLKVGQQIGERLRTISYVMLLGLAIFSLVSPWVREWFGV